jgi:hypothetical protein
MSEAVAIGVVERRPLSARALSAAGAFWLLVAFTGQWAFFYYIAAFYGTSALSGHFERWDRLAALGRGASPYIAGVLRFWTFGCYLVPLAVPERFLDAKDGAGPLGRVAVAGGLFLLMLLMAVGIFGFAVFSQAIISGAPLAFQ